MSRERFEERKGDVLRAAERFDELIAKPGSPIVRDATLQRFEFTFEAAWKALKLYLKHQGFSAESPRAVLKRAYTASLIPDQEEADAWLVMLEGRNLTTHVYREHLAEAIYKRILNTHAPLLVTMAERINGVEWE